MVSVEGGEPEMLLDAPGNEADPGWSPDGSSIVFGYLSEGDSPTGKAIRILNLETGAVSTVPGSTGLFSPRWSPDGRYLAAMPLDRQKLLLLDMTSGEWTLAKRFWVILWRYFSSGVLRLFRRTLFAQWTRSRLGWAPI
jgi:Tol biopolymer transport system component